MTEPPADLVFNHGTVVTVDRQFSLAEAAAVSHGRIVAVGREREIRGLIGPSTRVVDLDGGALLPGINDSHIHAAMLGAYWPHYWMDGMASGGTFPVPRELVGEKHRRAALRRAWKVLLPLGITSYTEPGLGPGADHQHGASCGAAMLETYRALAADGGLPIRVTALVLYGELDGPCDPRDFTAGVADLVPGQSGPECWLRVAGVKIFADGIPPARTAWMHQPYLDGGNSTLLMPGSDDVERARVLESMVDQAHARGLQVGVHATGSATIEATVRAFADAGARHGNGGLRHYVIHGDTASPETLELMAHHGFGLNTQAAIYTTTGAMLDAAIGPDRTDRAFPLRSAMDAGVQVSLSSDSPVLPPDWRIGVAAAVERRDVEGRMRGVSERIQVAEAIRSYTIRPAFQDHAESWKGSIEVGKVADLCVLDADPLVVGAGEIPSIGIRMTVIDGRIAYDSGDPTEAELSFPSLQSS